MKKTDRQSLIKEIISQHVVETQDDLIAYLEKSGVTATQATISRDIRELSIIKSHDQSGQVRYTIFTQSGPTNEDRLQEAIQDTVTKITQIHFINILNTNLGTADVVAALIDDIGYEEVAGSLAGTDTLVIFSHSEAEAAALNQRISAFIEE